MARMWLTAAAASTSSLSTGNALSIAALVIALLVGVFGPVWTGRKADKRQEEELRAAAERQREALEDDRQKVQTAWERERMTRWEERVLDLASSFLAATSQTVRLISFYAGEKYDGKPEAATTYQQFDDKRQECRALKGHLEMVAPALSPVLTEMFDKTAAPLRDHADSRDDPDLESAEWRRLHDESTAVRERFVATVRGELAAGRLHPDAMT